MLIAVDFDNTIATNRYPLVGDLIPNAKEVINMLSTKHMIMLWTVRGTEPLNEYGRSDVNGKTSSLKNAAVFCKDNGILIDFYNSNPYHPSNSPKQLADLVIDDINLGCPTMQFKGKTVVDWYRVAEILMKDGYISEEQFKTLKKYEE